MAHDRTKWEVRHGDGFTIQYRETTITQPRNDRVIRALEMDMTYRGPQEESTLNLTPYRLRTENWSEWFERVLTNSAAEIWLIRGTMTANPEIMCFLTMVYANVSLKPHSYLHGLARYNKHIGHYTVQAWSGQSLFGPHDEIMRPDDVFAAEIALAEVSLHFCIWYEQLHDEASGAFFDNALGHTKTFPSDRDALTFVLDFVREAKTLSEAPNCLEVVGGTIVLLFPQLKAKSIRIKKWAV